MASRINMGADVQMILMDWPGGLWTPTIAHSVVYVEQRLQLKTNGLRSSVGSLFRFKSIHKPARLKNGDLYPRLIESCRALHHLKWWNERNQTSVNWLLNRMNGLVGFRPFENSSQNYPVSSVWQSHCKSISYLENADGFFFW